MGPGYLGTQTEGVDTSTLLSGYPADKLYAFPNEKTCQDKLELHLVK